MAQFCSRFERLPNIAMLAVKLIGDLLEQRHVFWHQTNLVMSSNGGTAFQLYKHWQHSHSRCHDLHTGVKISQFQKLIATNSIRKTLLVPYPEVEVVEQR